MQPPGSPLHSPHSPHSLHSPHSTGGRFPSPDTLLQNPIPQAQPPAQAQAHYRGHGSVAVESSNSAGLFDPSRSVMQQSVNATLEGASKSSDRVEKVKYVGSYLSEVHFTALFIAGCCALITFFTSRTSHRFLSEESQPSVFQFWVYNIDSYLRDAITCHVPTFVIWLLYPEDGVRLLKPIVYPSLVVLAVADIVKTCLAVHPFNSSYFPLPLYTLFPVVCCSSGLLLRYWHKSEGSEVWHEMKRVIFSVLFTGVLFGLYVEFWVDYSVKMKEDWSRSLSRIVLHPIIWEIAQYVSRMAARQVHTGKDENVVILPAQIAGALSGRVLTTEFNSTEWSIATSFVISFEEIFLQLTKKERDYLYSKLFYRSRREEIFANANPHLSLMTFNDHIILECSGIVTAPFLVAFYSASAVSYWDLFTNALVAYSFEVIADLTVVIITRKRKKPVVEVWYSQDRQRYFWVVFGLNVVAVVFFMPLWLLLVVGQKKIETGYEIGVVRPW